MTRRAIAGLVSAAVLLAGSLASAQTIKLGTLAPEGSPWHAIIRDMAEAWTQASAQRLRVRIYAGGIAGDDPDMVRKMRVGQLDAAVLTGTGLYDIAPEIQALQMPRLLTDYDELDYVVERVAPRLEALLAGRGFTVLNWGDAGWVHFFTQRPVVYPADLALLRLFVWSGYTAYVEAWKDGGFQPVPLAGTDVHAALQSGLIGAVPTTPLAALSFQWFGLAPHMTALRWAPLLAATVIATPRWERLPAELRPRLQSAAREAGIRSRQETRRLGEDAVAVMGRHGLVVHPVPPAAVVEWDRRARQGYAKIVGPIVPPELVREVERLRDEYRAARRRP